MAEVWNESNIVKESFQTPIFSTIKSLTWYIFKDTKIPQEKYKIH